MKANKSRALRKVLAAGLAAALAATMTPALALAGERQAQDAQETRAQSEFQTQGYTEKEIRLNPNQSFSTPCLWRTYGETRYGTSQAIADYTERSGYGQGEGYGYGVIIASGASFADALSASGLAGALDYPILLTHPNALVTETIEALEFQVKMNDEAPIDIVIVGGEKAVSKKIETDLIDKGYASKVTRIAGNNRYETCMAIYEYGADRGYGWGDCAVVATGKNFPDALAISPFCAYSRAPIILVGDSLTQDQKNAIDDMNVVIVGGEAVVSKRIEQEITACCSTAPLRLAGSDRYETALEIVDFELDQAGMEVRWASLVTGANFPDALAAGPSSAENDSVLFLVAPSGKYDAPILKRLEDNVADITRLNIYGGYGVVSKSFEEKVADTVRNAFDNGFILI